MANQYRFIADPGHGWLEVPMAELVELGIADKITSYSYRSRDGLLAYLEEDCDLSTFARAKGWKPGEAGEHIREEHQDPTFVRGLPSFTRPAELWKGFHNA